MAMKSEPEAYKSHKAGSRKGDVHRVFDQKGPDAARELGLKLKLKPGTLTSWFGPWTRAKTKKPSPAPKSVKKSSEKREVKAEAVAASRT